VAPHWKLLGGLRYDSLDGGFTSYAIPANAGGPVTTTAYQQKISKVSKRFAVPSAWPATRMPSSCSCTRGP